MSIKQPVAATVNPPRFPVEAEKHATHLKPYAIRKTQCI